MKQGSKDAWVEVSVQVNSEAADAVSAILMEMGAGGVVIDDPRLLARRRQELGEDLIDEPGVTGAGLASVDEGGGLTVKAYVLPTKATPEIIAGLTKRVRGLTEFGLAPGDVCVTCQGVDEEDWAHAWKQYYKPLRVGRRIVIVPSWERWQADTSDVVLTLDPGMAFGTGTHPTTQMCLEALEKWVRPGQRVLDVGTGSGVLAIAAAKLGARVTAFDVDARAAEVAAVNVARNGVDSLVEVKPGTLEGIPAGSSYDIIVANIVAGVIIDLLPQIASRLSAKGLFIASGIVEERVDEVEKAWLAAQLKLGEVHRLGEWACLLGGGYACAAFS